MLGAAVAGLGGHRTSQGGYYSYGHGHGHGHGHYGGKLKHGKHYGGFSHGKQGKYGGGKFYRKYK